MRVRALQLGLATLLVVAAPLALAAAAGGTEEAPGFRGTVLLTSDADGDDDVYAVAARGGRVYTLTRNHDSEQVSALGPTVARAWRDWVFVLRRDGGWRRLAPGFADMYRGAVYDRGRRVVVMRRDALLVLTPGGRLVRRFAFAEGSSSVAPDARHVALRPAGRPKAGLTLIDVATGKTRRLGGPGDSVSSWSPDGSALVLSGNGYRLADVRSKRPATLLSREYVGVEWAPRGRSLAFATSDERRKAVTVVDVASRRRRTWPVSAESPRLTWSPDATRLVYGEGANIVVAQVSSGRRRTVASVPSLAQGPEWSPDGRRLAYVQKTESAPREKWALATVAASGGGARTLVRGDPVALLTWDRRSDRLLFATPGRLGSVGVDGCVHGAVAARFDKATEIFNTGRGDLVWSPDRRAVAFTAGFGGESVYVLATDGKRLVRLTRRGHDRIVAWLPTPVPRLARRATPLPPSERGSARVLDTRAPVVAVSAHGPAAGVLVAERDLDRIHPVVWRPGKGVARIGTPARHNWEAEVYPFDVELTGDAITWSFYTCGNDCYLDTYRAAPVETDMVTFVDEDSSDDAPVPPQPPVETRRGVVATTRGGVVRLQRLADGAERVVAVAGARIFDAELEDDGLFYAVNRRHGEFEGQVVFVPFDELFRSLP